MRVILDMIFNHSAHNWDYVVGENPPFKPWPGFYEKGSWVDANGQPTMSIVGSDAGVFPTELQADDYYTRAGRGSLVAGDIDDPYAENKWTDFDGSFRNFNYDDPDALNDVAPCFKYWIALTDCDGFRLDTLKHVSEEQGATSAAPSKGVHTRVGQGELLPGRRGSRARPGRPTVSRRARAEPQLDPREPGTQPIAIVPTNIFGCFLALSLVVVLRKKWSCPGHEDEMSRRHGT